MSSLNVCALTRRSAIARSIWQASSMVVTLSTLLTLSFPGGSAAALVLLPQTTTNPATAITTSDATLNGASGAADSDGHSFWVSPNPFTVSDDPTIPGGVYSTPDLGALTANTSFTAQLSLVTSAGFPSNMPAITPGTTYYFAAWTHPTGGSWTPGSVLSFTTATPVVAPAFTSSPVLSATMGTSYSYSITTTGTPAPAITATTTLPTGLSFVDNGNGTATLSGTPSVSGVFPIGLHAVNGGGTADQSYVLTIINPCDGWTLEGCNIASVNGQDGWKSTGSFDQSVVANDYGYPSLGTKVFRISNAVTSGSFGDQTFVKPVANEAGETYSSNGGHPVGTRQNHFEAQFDIAAAQSSEQTGLAISVSPDRGDGSRMSYLRFDDTSDGIDVTFYDVQGTGNPASFVPTEIAMLDRSVPHTVKFDMTFVDGPSNDIVKIYIDGTLVHTGTSWENYYRYDSESNAEKGPRTVNTLLIRAGGTAVPGTSGAGFLFDNFSFTADHATITPSSTTSTVTVHQGDLHAGPVATAVTDNSGKWFMYNDTNDTIDSTLGSFVVGPFAAPAGIGSADFIVGAAPRDRKNIATYAYSGTQLAQITQLSYSAYSHSGIAGPTESPFLAFNIDFSGASGSWQKRLVYVPSANGAVPQDTWNTFDAINGGAGMWSYSGATWPTTTTGPDAGVVGTPGTTARTWAAIMADYPTARILPVDGWLGVRVGEPGPTGYEGNIDKFVIGTNDGTHATTTTYDFEPTLTSDLAITKVADKSTAAVGDTVTYTITATNKGDGSDEAYGVTVTDLLPANLTFVSTSTEDTVGNYASSTGKWTIGKLCASTTVTLHISATVNAAALGSTLTNTATIADEYSNDPATSDNSASAAVTVPAPVTTSGGGSGGGNGPIAGSLSGGSIGQVLGISTSSAPTTGEGGSCGPYITTFLGMGKANDTEQVRRLQEVLSKDGETVAQTGVFDAATLAAVKAFQHKYASRILSPWGLSQPTGYVYLTTRKLLNEIHCNGAVFPLTAQEQAMINAFRSAGQGTHGNGGTQTPTGSTAPSGSQGTPESDETASSTGSIDQAGAAGSTGSSGGFWSWLGGIFHR